jgi:hypothetical protein
MKQDVKYVSMFLEWNSKWIKYACQVRFAEKKKKTLLLLYV